MRRISLVGNSGAGKTTLARSVAERLGVAHVELDAIFHQPDWTELPEDEFRARVAARLDELTEGWVTCGNYRMVRETVWGRADTVVWLDLPRRRVMQQVTARTVRRVVTREQLWNGNREPWQNLYAWAPERNIVRWAWTQHDKYTQQYAAAMADPRWSGLRFIRLRSPREIDRWLATL
jgi:adenylate kinase family enzyme